MREAMQTPLRRRQAAVAVAATKRALPGCAACSLLWLWMSGDEAVGDVRR